MWIIFMYRIMIVEDDKTIVEVLKRQLEQWNYQVISVKILIR